MNVDFDLVQESLSLVFDDDLVGIHCVASQFGDCIWPCRANLGLPPIDLVSVLVLGTLLGYRRKLARRSQVAESRSQLGVLG